MDYINKQSFKRASWIIRCLPFGSSFYEALKDTGLSSEMVFEDSSKYCVNPRSWFKSENSVEDAFRLLIKIGVLRREVDGQGLTSKIRLTPMGRKLLESRPKLFLEKVAVWEHLSFSLYRFWPF